MIEKIQEPSMAVLSCFRGSQHIGERKWYEQICILQAHSELLWKYVKPMHSKKAADPYWHKHFNPQLSIRILHGFHVALIILFMAAAAVRLPKHLCCPLSTKEQLRTSLRPRRGQNDPKCRLSTQWSWRSWASQGALYGLLCCRAVRRKWQHESAAASACASVTLLVDGDQHIRLEDDITNASATLNEEGRSVKTIIFGAFSVKTRQKLSRSLKLRRYCQHQDFHIREVPRIGNTGQPNDEEIIREVYNLSTTDECIALLVGDGDFAVAVKDAVSRGRHVVVFIPHSKPGTETVFRSTGARVVRLPAYQNAIRVCKVQAILNADGTGFVNTTSPVIQQGMESSSLVDFLSHFGYCTKGARPDRLCSAMVKFWFTNALGDSFTVYPYQTAVLDFKKMLIKHHGREWKPYQQNLAFFLPTKGGRRPSQEALQKYGSGFGPSVHQGGGPFMLNNSENLVLEALQKLGFLDQDLNSDPVEAMLVFCNISNNKGALLRMGLRPSSASTALENLRDAFLSSSTGMWEGPPSDVQVRLLLSDKRLLRDDASKNELWGIMKSYAQDQGLPDMKTYHGLVWRILRSLDSNPGRRETIEFCWVQTMHGKGQLLLLLLLLLLLRFFLFYRRKNEKDWKILKIL